jgi:hypothetical protein
MFEPTSRYANCKDAQFIAGDGRIITYKRRRFLPQGDKMQLLAEVVVKGGDRLDNITNIFVGNPEHYHLICDANNAMDPLELTSEPGRVLHIALPWR